ncbi:MAG TPA: LLM class flavin-dependent oxidoreductase, partial [Thermomicrobiales bacterium]|nr:LLM class flavin-dependent oxidoreductase [Thermomicrobiales bacterium]
MAERLKIGVQLPEVEYAARWSDYLTMARIAEDIGLDSIWLGDHLLYREPDGTTTGPWECLSLLSAVAAVTSRVEIGPLVLATGFRNPAVTAKMAETIDEISGGRLVLGLGAGWNQPEFEAFGVPFDNRLGRFTEAFNIIRHLLRYGEVSYNGIYHHLDACQIIPRGPRAGHIPIMIGSTGERMLRLTLPHVDAWNIWFADFANDPTRLAQHVQRMHGICDQL